MKAVIFSEKMILDLMTTGTAVKLSKVSPQPDTGLIWGGWILDTTGNEKDIGKGMWLDQYPLSTKEVRIRCPHGGVEDVRWVKETWRPYAWSADGGWGEIDYRADFQVLGVEAHDVLFSDMFPRGNALDAFRAPNNMPRWASRYTVQCTAVSVEQVKGIWYWRNEYKVTEAGEA